MLKLLLISLCHSLNILHSLYHSLNILMICTGMSLCHSLKILMIRPGIPDSTDLSCAAVNCVNWDFWWPTDPVPLYKAGRGLILHVLAGHELKLKSIQLVLLLEASHKGIGTIRGSDQFLVRAGYHSLLHCVH